MQVKKQQLEPCVEQLIVSRLKKEYDRAVCCHRVCLTYTLSTLVSVKPVSPGVIESPGCSCVSEALEGATEHLAHVASRVSPLFCRLFWTTARPAEDFPSPAVLWGAVHPYSVARYCFCAASVFLVVLLPMDCNPHNL